VEGQVIDFIVQSLAAGLLFYGLWQMGNRNLRGPFYAALAEIFTTIVGYWYGTWSIVLIGVVLFVVQARNFMQWRKDGVAW
jgi:hypothetical protein